MKVLFIGDSITNGKLGASFVDRVAGYYPGCQLNNLGKDGDTLNKITERLLGHLAIESSYEYIVLQGGYNDLLLPTFPHKGPLFRLAYNQQIKKGLTPLTKTPDIYNLLKNTVGTITSLCTSKIILLTVGCVGEKLSSALNKNRIALNQVIRTIVREENLLLADAAAAFETYLSTKEPSNYCLDSFWAVTVFDKMKKEFSELCEKRKLYLTIDGVHLNKTGAELFANSVLKELKTNMHRV